MRALTDDETATVDALTSGDFTNFAAMTAELDGRDVALVVAVTHDGDDYTVTPMAVLVDDDLASRLNPGFDHDAFDTAVTQVEHDHEDDGEDG